MKTEKTQKLNIPVYNPSSQMEFINNFCKEFDFPPQTLITLILAEFIYTVENAALRKNMSYSDIFVTYLQGTVKTGDEFKKLKKLVEVKK